MTETATDRNWVAPRADKENLASFRMRPSKVSQGKTMSSKWITYDILSPSNLPNIPCVYCMIHDGVVIYIGSTLRLKNRLYGHNIRHGYAKNIHTPWMDIPCTSNFTLKVKPSRKYGDWAMDELRLIRKLQPKFNTQHKKQCV